MLVVPPNKLLVLLEAPLPLLPTRAPVTLPWRALLTTWMPACSEGKKGCRSTQGVGCSNLGAGSLDRAYPLAGCRLLPGSHNSLVAALAGAMQLTLRLLGSFGTYCALTQ